MRMQDSLDHARRGYDLLERKRQILVMELMDNMEAARTAQQRVRDAMKKAFEALRRAAVQAGAERLARESCGIRPAHRLSIRTRSVMGVSVPDISFECPEAAMPFGLLAGAGGADEVREAFLRALEPIVELAQVENAILRLTRELKKTQRRVNALDNTFIPRYRDTLEFIEGVLQERQREELVVMKKVKAMHGREQRRAGEQQHG
jgi:V/A-type H+-transporting ATPase subunit D